MYEARYTRNAFEYFQLSAREVEESRVRYNDSISINLAKAVFLFCSKGSSSRGRRKESIQFFHDFPLPWRSVSPNYNLLNDDRAVLLIIHGGAGRVAVTGLKGGRRRSDKKSSRSGGGLRRGNSRVGDDFRGATR